RLAQQPPLLLEADRTDEAPFAIESRPDLLAVILFMRRVGEKLAGQDHVDSGAPGCVEGHMKSLFRADAAEREGEIPPGNSRLKALNFHSIRDRRKQQPRGPLALPLVGRNAMQVCRRPRDM